MYYELQRNAWFSHLYELWFMRNELQFANTKHLVATILNTKIQEPEL
jgi:hypothetical protein